MRLTRLLTTTAATATLTLALALPAAAATPNGLKGYEGQPGHQGGGTAQGLKGYEGQPGHQAGFVGPRTSEGNHHSKKCAPGQHGNPKPGHKPGSCKK
jgi:hypothetical protein